MMNKRSNKTTLHTGCGEQKGNEGGNFCLIIVLENLFYILIMLIASLFEQRPTAIASTIEHG